MKQSGTFICWLFFFWLVKTSTVILKLLLVCFKCTFILLHTLWIATTATEKFARKHSFFSTFLSPPFSDAHRVLFGSLFIYTLKHQPNYSFLISENSFHLVFSGCCNALRAGERYYFLLFLLFSATAPTYIQSKCKRQTERARWQTERARWWQWLLLVFWRIRMLIPSKWNCFRAALKHAHTHFEFNILILEHRKMNRMLEKLVGCYVFRAIKYFRCQRYWFVAKFILLPLLLASILLCMSSRNDYSYEQNGCCDCISAKSQM